MAPSNPVIPKPGIYDHLDLRGGLFEEFPDNVRCKFRLDLSNSPNLQRLPDGLKTGWLNLTGCRSLESLPEGMELSFLTIDQCEQLTAWPKSGILEAGRLSMRGCTGLTELPDWLGGISQLDLRDCSNIQRLPDSLNATSWIDVAGTSIKALPKGLRVGLRWRGVMIDERIAFRPHEITGREVLAEENAELRRVKLERIGFEKFLSEVDASLLDTDRDPGGERRLLKVDLGSDEPLVCVSVFCPSTARQYIIRVPPATKTCHQAIAWTAGFDNAADYHPLIET